MMEVVLVLTTIAQKFHLRLAETTPVRPRPSFTLRPERGIKVVVTGR
jgi:cytochrome P450